MIRELVANWPALKFPYRKHFIKYQCIFIHIPKTAGTSVTSALGAVGGRDHLPWYVYYTANPALFDKYYKFCFVRNPWERVLSAYKYLESGGNQNRDLQTMHLIKAYGSFDAFVRYGLGEGHFRNHLLFLPQSEFVVGPEQNIVVDFVGRFECLNRDFAAVAKRLGVSTIIGHINKSEKVNDVGLYKSNYSSSESIEVVHQIYKQDVRIFDYKFE
jgi:hypothetical protein